MTDTLTAVAELRDLPIGAIAPSPDNPRSDLGDLEGLAASIKSEGIVEPLIVTWEGDDGYVVVAGHRRLEASKKAGLDVVPCIVRDLDPAGRAVARTVENLQREDLAPVDEARALAQLVELGLSQRQIAERVGCSQAHVSKRLALLKLPVAAQHAVGADDGLTLEDAVALTAVPSKTVEKLFAKGAPKQWEVRRAIDDHERAAKRAAEIKRLKDAGITVVDKAPGYNQRLDSIGIKADDHKSEPCHVAYVDEWGGRTQTFCTDPKRHAAKGESTIKVPPKPKPSAGSSTTPARETAAQKAQREERERRYAAMRVADDQRRGFAQSLVQRKTLPATSSAFAVAMWCANEYDPPVDDALGLLDQADPGYDTRAAALADFASGGPRQSTQALYALALATGNLLLSDTNGRGAHLDDWELVTVGPYVAHLVAEGYEPSRVERWLLGEVDTWEEPPAIAEGVSIEISPAGKKFKVTCSACGVVGKAPASSEAFAKERGDKHLADEHAAVAS
jgi:ParB family transcriptional regulator, chromosome partitioning protein